MRNWDPPPNLTISEWANRERYLSSESSSAPGKYSTDAFPPQKGMQDAISDPRTEMVVGMLCAQVGKSEGLVNNPIGFHIHWDPAPILLMQPTLENAEDYSKDRIAPMLRDTPALRNIFGDEKSRSGNNTLRHKKFPGGHLTLVGANSPAALASRPIRILLMDEVDRYPVTAGEEGDPVNLALKRTTTFHNRKIVAVSTPTIKGKSRIEKLYLEGDQREYEMPCPHCREFIVFKWEQIDWDKKTDDPQTTTYTCQACSAVIEERFKMKMLHEGRWVARAEFKGIASFHLNEIYSPWKTWPAIVADFIRDRKSPMTLRTWWNTSLGLPYEEKGDAPEHQKLYLRREDYKIGSVPKRVLFLTSAVDVQKDRLEVLTQGFSRSERWNIEHKVFYGDTSSRKNKPWLELDKYLYEEFEHESGQNMAIRVMAVDSGYNTSAVYAWVKDHPGRAYAVKGSATVQSIISAPKNVEYKKDGKKINRGLRVWHVGTDIAKSEVYAFLRIEKPTDETLAENGGRYPPGYIHFPKFEEEFFKQLTAEALVSRVVRGYATYEWIKIYDRNEILDLHVYNRAAAAIYGMDRFKEKNWRALEEIYIGESEEEMEAETVVKEQRKSNADPVKEVVKKSRIRFKRSGYL
ncbi:hypothetical protein Bb109J_c1964 [Bdellovibrio bacteriovorus]|uniref:phage terminase large subunit family protein n=1 Tax=Bdellovibrio bacteriovorus TaxID=959 RepID=UPI000571F9E9|nr:phage terminase large subunit family protein [Bdellovibrio bacteriovorus]BEV68544.1 hypothetical protein Bb109J_c1964 [Bdellovibrio bacteriovorus]